MRRRRVTVCSVQVMVLWLTQFSLANPRRDSSLVAVAVPLGQPGAPRKSNPFHLNGLGP
jgi:hypothetical protein